MNSKYDDLVCKRKRFYKRKLVKSPLFLFKNSFQKLNYLFFINVGFVFLKNVFVYNIIKILIY